MGSVGLYDLEYLSGDNGWTLLAGLGSSNATYRNTLCYDITACGASCQMGVAYGPHGLTSIPRDA
jgi:hypothetical protein